MAAASPIAEQATGRAWWTAGLPRNIFAIGVVSLLTDISGEMIVPVLPLFLTAALGAPPAAVGLIEGVAESTAAVLRIFSGWISDRIGRRKELVVVGYCLSNLVKPLLAVTTAWPQVLAIRFSDRFGKGIRGAPRDALIADSVEPSERGKAFGFHQSMDTTGAAIGPLLAAAILALTMNDARMVFWLAGVPSIATIICAVWLVKDRPVEPKTGAPPTLGFRGLGRSFCLFTAISVLFAIGNSSDAFLILRAQNVGMAVAVIPLAYFGFNALHALLATPAGMLSDRIGRRPLLILSYAVFAAVYAGFAVAGDAFAVGALFLLYSAYYAASEGVAKALVTDLVPVESRATALGTYAAATAIALLPASILAGVAWQAVGPWAPFAIGAGLAAAAAAMMAVVPLYPARAHSN